MFLVAISLTSCYTLGASIDIGQLSRGMSIDEVCQQFGNPVRKLSETYAADGSVDEVYEFRSYSQAYALEFINGYLDRYDYISQDPSVGMSSVPGYYMGYGFYGSERSFNYHSGNGGIYYRPNRPSYNYRQRVPDNSGRPGNNGGNSWNNGKNNYYSGGRQPGNNNGNGNGGRPSVPNGGNNGQNRGSATNPGRTSGNRGGWNASGQQPRQNNPATRSNAQPSNPRPSNNRGNGGNR